MKTDLEIKRDVEAELEWDSQIDATDVAVQVKNGVVDLSGFVHSFSEKYEAQQVAKRIAGVHAIADDIVVRIPTSSERSDPEIARDVVAALKAQLPSDCDHISVLVKDGWVTLEGAVQWHFGKRVAESAIHRLKGIRGITNLVAIRPSPTIDDVKRQIEEAFRRSADIDARRIQVEVNGTEVVLTGSARSWAERDDAQRAVLNAPGVTQIHNRITIASCSQIDHPSGATPSVSQSIIKRSQP